MMAKKNECVLQKEDGEMKLDKMLASCPGITNKKVNRTVVGKDLLAVRGASYEIIQVIRLFPPESTIVVGKI